MIKYVKGDIFKGNEDVIVHGCNCFCVMGAGIAAQIKQHYPAAYDEDRQTTSGNREKLGSYTFAICPHIYNKDKMVTMVNAYTQYDMGAWNKPFDYEAFEIVLGKIKNHFKVQTIAMPKIGAGLAGGDWNKIESIINTIFADREIVVYVL